MYYLFIFLNFYYSSYHYYCYYYYDSYCPIITTGVKTFVRLPRAWWPAAAAAAFRMRTARILDLSLHHRCSGTFKQAKKQANNLVDFVSNLFYLFYSLFFFYYICFLYNIQIIYKYIYINIY